MGLMSDWDARPIAAVVAGVNAIPGRVMGHAGAFALPGEPDALTKVQALEAAGVAVINHPSRFGPVLKTLLSGARSPSGIETPSTGVAPLQQRRSLNTFAGKRPSSTRPGRPNSSPWRATAESRRNLYLDRDVALDLLRQQGFGVSKAPDKVPDSARRLLAVSINRDTSSPCIIASPVISDPDQAARSFGFDYIDGEPDLSPIRLEVAKTLGLGNGTVETERSLFGLLDQLAALFRSKEAFLLQTHITVNDQDTVQISRAHLGFDDAALRSGKRQADVHALRDTRLEDPAELAAEPNGIVYLKLGGDDESHNIGTLVNGAGLAMNMVDALADAGGRAANFLDTGGKATSETVKRSFEVILRDERVKVRTVGRETPEKEKEKG